MSTGILKVQNDKIVGDDGQPVVLRGAALGGRMRAGQPPGARILEGRTRDANGRAAGGTAGWAGAT